METQWGAIYYMANEQLHGHIHLNVDCSTALRMFIVQHPKNNLFKTGCLSVWAD